jgi:hypothetical protein
MRDTPILLVLLWALSAAINVHYHEFGTATFMGLGVIILMLNRKKGK